MHWLWQNDFYESLLRPVIFPETPAEIGLSLGATAVASVLSAGGGAPAGGARAAALMLRLKAVSLPAWRKVGIDMAHVLTRHTAGGALAAGRTVFPRQMSEKAIERTVRQAYRYGERVLTQGDRVQIRGRVDGYTIEMWVNKATKVIETAYPVF